MNRPPTTLQEWISPKYLSTSELERFKKLFFAQQPFPHLECKNFFRKEKIILVVKALAGEKFISQQADLFKFKQAGDLAAAQSKVLREFRSFLISAEFITYMNYITSTVLKPKSIDMSGTLYENTDYLLCHDDQLESRKIAYFLYLSDLNKNDGGALHLFSSKPGVPTPAEVTIIPTFNTFAFFLVSNSSFHEVEEVVRDVQRIAISGWFHDQ